MASKETKKALKAKRDFRRTFVIRGYAATERVRLAVEDGDMKPISDADLKTLLSDAERAWAGVYDAEQKDRDVASVTDNPKRLKLVK